MKKRARLYGELIAFVRVRTVWWGLARKVRTIIQADILDSLGRKETTGVIFFLKNRLKYMSFSFSYRHFKSLVSSKSIVKLALLYFSMSSFNSLLSNLTMKEFL